MGKEKIYKFPRKYSISLSKPEDQGRLKQNELNTRLKANELDNISVISRPLLSRSVFIRPRPFLKWAGGKGQLLRQYEPYFPEKFNNYLEPFLGGGGAL